MNETLSSKKDQQLQKCQVYRIKNEIEMIRYRISESLA